MAKRAAVSVEDYRSYNDGTTIFSVEDNLEAFQPGTDLTSLQFAARKLSEFLIKTNLIREKPDLSNLFDDRFVKAYAAKSDSRYVPVRLGFSAWPGWLPWQVAQSDDIFEDGEVTVDLNWFNAYGDSIKALVDGEIDANSQTLHDTIIAEAKGINIYNQKSPVNFPLLLYYKNGEINQINRFTSFVLFFLYSKV